MKKQIIIAVMTIVILIAVTFTTGCAGQDNGMRVDVVKWDSNGLRIGSIETNGSQVVVAGKDTKSMNEDFNQTARAKNSYNHVETMGEQKSSLTKTLSKQGRSTEEIQTLTQDFLTRK